MEVFDQFSTDNKEVRYPGAYSSDEPTPFEKSGLADEAELKAWDVSEAEKKFYGQRDPHYAIKHEQPVHRAAALLKAQGYTNKEIASQLGLTPVCVSNVVRQPWAVKLILEEVQKAGREQIAAMFTMAKEEVAQNLLDMATGRKAGVPAAVQKSACDSVIDRLLGKATQPIAHTYSDNDLDKLPDSELMKLARGN